MNSDKALNFAAAYNDLETYPTAEDVAAKLDITAKTVRNFAAILRTRRETDDSVPELIRRTYGKTKTSPVAEEKLSPLDHAKKRAGLISAAMDTLFTSTRYPVINPEALVIEHRTSRRYDAVAGDYVEVAQTPRVWLTDTLRVAPIADAAERTFIFTGAQNDAPIHDAFWDNLVAYADHHYGEVIVGPWTYETNWWDENSPTARSYDPRIEDSLCFGQLRIGDNFMFGGEMNTLPTSPRPVSDLTSYGEGRWAVYPHARRQLLSVPSTMPGEQAHQVMSTGAVTIPKVVPRKAGIKSIFHHVLGAVIVQFDKEGRVFCRQITAAADGSFYDLDNRVAGGVVTSGHRARAITFADAHVAKLGRKNSMATFGFDYKTGDKAAGSLLEVLRPEHLFIEDVHDHESRSHHREKDVSHDYEMAVRSRESVKGEVERTVRFLTLLRSLIEPDSTIHVVESNHDVALERYVREGRYRLDGINLTYGLKLDLAYHQWREEVAHCLDAGKPTPKFSLLEWAVKDLGAPDDIHWIYDGVDSFILDGIELGHHGHRGTNGAHGSAAGFARLGRPMTIGDKHSPAILDGVFVAGVMELQHGYNKGPSGWCTTHVIQYPDGSRTLITLQDGFWRGM